MGKTVSPPFAASFKYKKTVAKRFVPFLSIGTAFENASSSRRPRPGCAA